MATEVTTKGASTSGDKKTNRQPSLNSLALVRKATTPYNNLSMNIKDWHRVVYEGVLLKNDTQKFWVDAKLHKNCFLVLPKACDIAGGHEESCWSWITKEEKWFSFHSTVDIPVPKSNKLSWLLIRGKFKTRVLSPNTTYEVAFMVHLIGTSFGLREVNLELDLPDGTKETGKVDLRQKPESEWIKLHAGEFMMGPKTVGTISFTLCGSLLTGNWGLTLKGVLIHPKDEAKHNQLNAGEKSSCN